MYERLLDALCGKTVEASDEGGVQGSKLAPSRDFAQSDLARYAELFIPAAHRDAVLGFVRGNVCKREEIGLKTTGNGVIALCNWHVLVEADEVNNDVDEESIHAEGADLVPSEIARRVLPLTPSRTANGNTLDILDRRSLRWQNLKKAALYRWIFQPRLTWMQAQQKNRVKNTFRTSLRILTLKPRCVWVW